MEPRRREAAGRPGPPPDARAARLARRVAGGRRRGARARATTGCTCRGTTPRYLRRNALVALGNVGGAEHEPRSLERYAADDDALVREHAALGARSGSERARELEQRAPAASAGSRSCGSAAVPFAVAPGRVIDGLPAGLRALGLGDDRRPRASARRSSSWLVADAARRGARPAGRGRARLRHRRSSRRSSSSSPSSRRRRSGSCSILVADRGGVALRDPRRARARRSRRRPCCSRLRVAARATASTTTSTSTTSRSRSASRLLIGADRRLARQRLRERDGERATRGPSEAEQLRDELGRRADLLEAANRCARALGSSLELDEAFGAFIRELRGPRAVRPDRDRARRGGHARGDRDRRRAARRGACRPARAPARPARSRRSIAQRRDRSYRRDMREPRASARSATLVELGLRSRLAAPLLLGARADRDARGPPSRADAFSADEIELVGAARPARRDRGPEHPRVRGRAPHGRGAAAALGAARGLRLARLARAAQPDGGRDRLGADAAGSAGAS